VIGIAYLTGKLPLTLLHVSSSRFSCKGAVSEQIKNQMVAAASTWRRFRGTLGAFRSCVWCSSHLFGLLLRVRRD